MAADPTESEILQIEVALRDSRHIEVIMALDRLVLLPETRKDMERAMDDLKRVKSFIDNHLPRPYLVAAEKVFVKHGRLMKEHFLAARNSTRN